MHVKKFHLISFKVRTHFNVTILFIPRPPKWSLTLKFSNSTLYSYFFLIFVLCIFYNVKILLPTNALFI